MPGAPHEVPLLLFRERPELLLQLLRDAAGVDVPAYARVQIEEAEVAQIVPPSYHADLVVSLHDGGPVMAIVLEVQRATDPGKRARWPSYVADVHAKLGCASYLVVFATTNEVARWAAKPIATFQPGSSFAPIVLGPDQIPVVASVEVAVRSPELAVLSVLAHAAEGGRAQEIALAALAGAALLDDARSALYTDIILNSLGATQRAALEVIIAMNIKDYEFKSAPFVNRIAEMEAQGRAAGLAAGLKEGKAEGKAEGRAEGKAEGQAHALLAVLSAVVSSSPTTFDRESSPLATWRRWIAGYAARSPQRAPKKPSQTSELVRLAESSFRDGRCRGQAY
jgi:hypothetical protein